MYVAHYQGQGKGFLSGKTEYVVFFRDRPKDEQLEPAPGFRMVGKVQYTIFCGDDSLLPTGEILVRCS